MKVIEIYQNSTIFADRQGKNGVNQRLKVNMHLFLFMTMKPHKKAFIKVLKIIGYLAVVSLLFYIYLYILVFWAFYGVTPFAGMMK